MDKVVEKIKDNKVLLCIIIFIIGVAIGAIFYPSKTSIKEVEVDKKETLQKIETLKGQLTSLETQNRQLKQQIKEHKVEIHKPDGTVIITTDTETVVEEYETKVKELSQKYENEIAQYKTQIEKMQEYSKVEINKKRFGVEVGILLNRDYYAHANATVFGPIFVGFHAQLGNTNTLGAGIGLNF